MGVMMEEKKWCPRCHGFMVPVILDDSKTVVLDWRELPGCRCVNCGECIDPVILANRLASRQDERMGQKPCLP